MNDLLQVKLNFKQKKNEIRPQPLNLPEKQKVNVEQLREFLFNLVEVRKYWESQNLLPGILISVYYNKVVAKSNRLKGILGKGSITPNESIVGARFSSDDSPKHIITHYVKKEILDEAISRVESSISILNENFNGCISNYDINQIYKKKLEITFDKIAKSNFIKVIVDAHHVEKFDILVDEVSISDDAIITLYKTDIKTIDLLSNIGINILSSKIMDDTTVLLRPDQLEKLKINAPFLIAMAVSNLSEVTKDDFDFIDDGIIKIPKPNNEPTIGVIDTLFDENVYFSEWVQYKKYISEEIDTISKDYHHGTSVSSIIVDGPAFNERLDDGCGRFKVRHFGVATASNFSSFSILRSISQIVSENKDIKVWNISLGAKLDIHPNFISPEASILDKIQFENDVLFVIAGTNLNYGEKSIRNIGSPADSINSIVVNSVNSKGVPASYSRKGPVLSFFTKPDVSYYGGDEKEPMRVCTPTGESFARGTSFAAPWISRKLSYLIDILGMSREVAKALLIHSATGWQKQNYDKNILGHGVVPIRIEDVIKCQDDEIQFIVQGISEEYNTYDYNIPIPIVKEKHPFIAKATLCYFPACSRNQGVDYTNTELDLSFGRFKGSPKKAIESINSNYQSTEFYNHTWEKDARSHYRKWDNVKHIREILTGNNKDKKSYESGRWALSFKTKERLDEKFGIGLPFGIVITFKEINGVNRVEEFINMVKSENLIVHKINVDNRVDIFNIAEEEIEFD